MVCSPSLYIGNYDCVQADGSTFFIMAPNTTNEEHTLNTTFLAPANLPAAMANDSDDHSKYLYYKTETYP